MTEELKDLKRRIDRIEQCIYMLSISDDVKSVDILEHVRDLAHQMYGEYQARIGNNEDYLIEDDINY